MQHMGKTFQKWVITWMFYFLKSLTDCGLPYPPASYLNIIDLLEWNQFRLRGKESTCQCRRHGFDPWAGKMPWRRAWRSTAVCLPGESHGQRSPVGYSSWGCIESDMTEYAGAYCLTTSLASIIMVTVDISNRFQTLIKIAVMIWF